MMVNIFSQKYFEASKMIFTAIKEKNYNFHSKLQNWLNIENEKRYLY